MNWEKREMQVQQVKKERKESREPLVLVVSKELTGHKVIKARRVNREMLVHLEREELKEKREKWALKEIKAHQVLLEPWDRWAPKVNQDQLATWETPVLKELVLLVQVDPRGTQAPQVYRVSKDSKDHQAFKAQEEMMVPRDPKDL